jgi:DMSO/TMAO reductase YedYZ molybdopterin-dependent catalytic subunit
MKQTFFRTCRHVCMLIMMAGLSVLIGCSGVPGTVSSFSGNPSVPGEVEATEFLGTKLTPISQQLNNALAGTQHIDKDTYTLTINGLVDNPLKLTYSDLLALPQISKLMPLDCVEGWNFTAKWTGPSLPGLFSMAKVQPAAKLAIFYTSDVSQGYSSLNLDYINNRNIIIALKLNDITLPDERGFPFQVVAESKYGYKWSKWIVRIELSDNTNFRGYWEGRGYNNNADVGGPAFDSSP